MVRTAAETQRSRITIHSTHTDPASAGFFVSAFPRTQDQHQEKRGMAVVPFTPCYNAAAPPQRFG
jgi:hypothetical protein